jgi:hypothetical protein
MTTRYFEIRAPRADFTGKIGPVSFADGKARVQFDDTRDDNGMSTADEHQISPGRSMVLFARRKLGYTVIELDEHGKPVGEVADVDKPAPPARSASTDTWRAYAVALGMTKDAADALGRDELAERFLGPKGGAE